MHHVPALERLMDSEENSHELKHLEVLLRFLRPMFEQQYVPAELRSGLDQPTSKFEDLWVLMKPGLLAYTKWDGEWIGCIVEQSTKLSPKPSEDLPQRWSIEYSILQLHWPSEEIRSARNSIIIDHYDGEKLVTSLPICPAQFYDAGDMGVMKQKLTQRGQKACRIIWEGPRYMFYHGTSLSSQKAHISERIVLGSKKENWILKDNGMHRWAFNWAATDDVLGSSEPLTPAEQKLKSDKRPTMDQFAIISPCLGAMFHVDRVKPLENPNYFPDPILSNRHLVTINQLVDYQGSNGHSPSPNLSNESDKGITILLHGPPWCWEELHDWAFLVESLIRSMASFRCLLFLTTNKIGTLRDRISSLVDLTVYIDGFDDERRSRVWEALTESFQHQHEKVVLSQGAKELLLSPETQIDWNGHEMKHCFKTAIALATSQANQESAAGSDTITVDDENFIEAMNIAHEFRLYLRSLYGDEAKYALMQLHRNDAFDGAAQRQVDYRTSAGVSDYNSDSDGRRGPASEGSYSRPVSQKRPKRPSDPSLCVPELNCLEWESFREAGNNRELFRKTKFYAIDVLVGEPRIILKPDRKGRRRQKTKVQGGAFKSTSKPQGISEQELNRGPVEAGEEPLPERIRINSPALVKAFSEITEESITSPFLLFRPFRSLIYYEHELRSWATQQERICEAEAEFDDDPVFVHYNHVEFDGTEVGPVLNVTAFPRYEGKSDLRSLDIYPLRHAKDSGLRDRLISRGRLFLKVAGIKHMHYTGLTLGTRDELDSPVVIDFEEAFARYPSWIPRVRHVADEWKLREAEIHRSVPLDEKPLNDWMFYWKNALQLRDSPCIEECCASETTHYDEYVEIERMKDYLNERMKEADSSTPSVSIVPRAFKRINEGIAPTDEDFLIMTFSVFGFALRNRKWYALDITNLSEVAILGEEKASISSYSLLATEIWSSRGLIMLLHGVPGVGKTSTAECVAAFFRSPLFQITGGDLGTTAQEVEGALEQNFSLASRWNCILLIDEADVFLGERNREDFKRNSLVAVFLRMMEYYSGILFLTTNRVGVFDEAFTSRIHISLYYPPLKREATRQIFEKNWERIKSRYEKNNKKIEIKESEITQFALDYFDNNKEGQWNGRQIRNAFQSALALAELEALGTDDDNDDPLGEKDHGRTVVLGKKYFESVADTYKEFLSYLKQVYGADVARRARENLWRNDLYGFQKTPNALNTRLKVAEPAPPAGMTPPRAPPGPGLQPQAAYGHGYKRGAAFVLLGAVLPATATTAAAAAAPVTTATVLPGAALRTIPGSGTTTDAAARSLRRATGSVRSSDVRAIQSAVVPFQRTEVA
ncbi:hypothetical protein PG987_002033 [Apiospora arundinis]